MRPRLEDVLRVAEAMGLRVEWVPLPPKQRGAYDLATHTIYLSDAMSDGTALPSLLHELEHARRGDDGHQAESVEKAIDRMVAHMLITEEEYARAEYISDGRDSHTIAAELELPKWVVSAFREELWKKR